MVDAGIQVKFENNKAILSKGVEIIAIANRCGHFIEIKISIGEKSAKANQTRMATISSAWVI